MENLSDIFSITKFIIPVKQINKPIYLIPFGDIHRYASLCAEYQWLEFCEWAKNKKDCYFLGMGDYDDFLSYSERKGMANFLNDDSHDETKQTFDDLIMKRVVDFYNEIKFMKGKIIGLIEGNHYANFCYGGHTTTQELAQMIGCEYLGANSFIDLSFHYGNKVSNIKIWAHHGLGASRLIGGSLNRVEQMSDIAIADIYLMGHDHKKSIALRQILDLKNKGNHITLSNKKILFARTGSFLKGYVPNTRTYVAKKQLNPTDIGVVKIELTPRRKANEQDLFYVDIHASI